MARSRLGTLVEGFGGAALVAAAVLVSPLIRPWYRRWGATGAEEARVLPGDEFVSHPRSGLTCAITIRAPASQVWPWFVQLGCQRAGWYSYDLLDNGGHPSADRIVDQFQHLAVGDVVKAVPDGSFGFPVAVIEPGRALVLAGTLNTRTGQSFAPGMPGLEPYFSGVQAFVIDELEPGTSRLVFRMRMDWSRSALNTLTYCVILEPTSFVMTRRMLLNVKRRAETLARQQSAPPAGRNVVHPSAADGH